MSAAPLATTKEAHNCLSRQPVFAHAVLLALVVGCCCCVQPVRCDTQSPHLSTWDSILSTMPSTLAISDSYVYGSSAQKISASWSSSGETAWAIYRNYTSPNYGNVVVSADGQRVFNGNQARDALTGALLWTNSEVGVHNYCAGGYSSCLGTLSADGATFFVFSTDNNLYALAAEDGHIIWQRTGLWGGFPPIVTPDGTKVFLSGSDEALDASDGSTLWTSSLLSTWIVVSADSASIFSWGSLSVAVLDANTGLSSRNLTTGTPLFVGTGGVLSDDGATLYVTGRGVDAVSMTSGAVLWSTTLSDDDSIAVNSRGVLSPDGNRVLYVSTFNGAAALDTSDGSILWTYTCADYTGSCGEVSYPSAVLSPDGRTFATITKSVVSMTHYEFIHRFLVSSLDPEYVVPFPTWWTTTAAPEAGAIAAGVLVPVALVGGGVVVLVLVLQRRRRAQKRSGVVTEVTSGGAQAQSADGGGDFQEL